jgi:hypothetical protein
MCPVPRRLIDDVYDVLEGSLADLLRARENVTEHIDVLVLQSRVRALRAAVAALDPLVRDRLLVSSRRYERLRMPNSLRPTIATGSK